MALSAGTRLGPYEILSALGAGGMGEVYRARDTKLDRAVAIKILPEAFAADTERIARFQREAKTLASLNHPNIAHIHGLEESNGVRALVMELVEGEDLAQRIARGTIPVAEALPIAKQMADALEAAHEQGIIHRDLKPANIKVRRDGTVKVLDFGLAKAMERTGVASPSVSQSPTITTPAMTQAGMILGTAAYMARSRRAASRWTSAPTSGRSAACSTRCSRGSGRSTARVSRKRWRVSSSVSRSGLVCPRRFRTRCRPISDAVCTRTAGLLKVKISGGPAVAVARLEGDGPRGATWGPDDTIIAATYGGATGLRRVAAAGGPTAVLTRPDRRRAKSIISGLR